MVETLKKHFSPDRSIFPETFSGELNYQSAKILPIAAFISIFAWLGYIEIDSQEYPNEPVIVALRYGLAFVGLLLFILYFLPALKKHSMYLMFILGLYVETATGILTGLTKGDPVYMGGYMYVLIIPIVAPIKKYLIWIMVTISLILFFITGISKGMEFPALRDQYKLRDLFTCALLAYAFSYILDRVRFYSWEKSQKIENQKTEMQVEKEKSDTIVADAKSVVQEVMKALDILNNFSNDINKKISDQMEAFSESRGVSVRLTDSFKAIDLEIDKQLDINKHRKDISNNMRNNLNMTAQNGKRAIDDAQKIMSLSDECDNKLQNARFIVEKLKVESSKIEEISKAINDIADRTNLLSLNASIESARAGEHGRGFAVVSEEISKLAENSIASAGEIGNIIKNSVTSINKSSNQLVDTSQSLNDIIKILDKNKAFLEEFVDLVISQDIEVQTLISYIDKFVDFTQFIDDLASRSAESLSQSQSIITNVENFYSELNNISDNLSRLSKDLFGHISSLQNTLTVSE